jgi:ABC-type bacteriocin/lantibiotic exporter with double-glycine peptidase domain
MDQVLYYPSVNIPVLAVTDNGQNAVLITGYGPENVAIWDPAQGSTLMKREEANTLFSASGNRFLTYVPVQSTD